jgi:hypothetical protein
MIAAFGGLDLRLGVAFTSIGLNQSANTDPEKEQHTRCRQHGDQ